MSKHTGNEVWEKQQSKLVRATFKKAFISSVNASARNADIVFAENPNNIIRAVPLATHISTANILLNQRCRVDIFDETNNRDMVIAYLY